MPVEKSQKLVPSEISVEITDSGVRRVVIYADDAAQQARAHRLLARIASQMVELDHALKGEPK
jgi:hypothetical protein